MSVLQSLLIKLGMLAMTMGVVLWIGWQVPQTMQRPAVTHAASLSSDDTSIHNGPGSRFYDSAGRGE